MNKASRVAVVGAGISGLAFSIAIKQLGFTNIRIFEKDASFQSRRQGYGLTILQGKTALKKLGILEEVKRYNAPSKAHYIFDSSGSILGFYGPLYWDHRNNNRSLKSVEKGLSMHVPRQALRKVLLDRYQSISKLGEVSWNSSLESIEFSKQSVQLSFTNNIKYEADFVFGCDGINSLVRKASEKHEQPLNYLGVMIVLGLCRSEHGLTKNRVFQTADGEFRLFSMPFLPGDPEMASMWQLSFRIDQAKSHQYASNMPKLKEFLSERLRTWHAPIPQMIHATKQQNWMAIPAYDRDPIWPELKDERVILLGDALHPMSPFKGQGANQALIDAIEVSELLTDQSAKRQLFSTSLKERSERSFNKVVQSRQRVKKYHEKQFPSINNFVYAGIDEKLIKLLQQSGITASNGDNIEKMILEVMRSNNYT